MSCKDELNEAVKKLDSINDARNIANIGTALSIAACIWSAVNWGDAHFNKSEISSYAQFENAAYGCAAHVTKSRMSISRDGAGENMQFNFYNKPYTPSSEVDFSGRTGEWLEKCTIRELSEQSESILENFESGKWYFFGSVLALMAFGGLRALSWAGRKKFDQEFLLDNEEVSSNEAALEA